MDADETHREPPPRSYEEMDAEELVELLVDRDGELGDARRTIAALRTENYELRVDLHALRRRSLEEKTT